MRALLLCVLLLSSGCITVGEVRQGNPVEPEKIERLEPGQSTLPEILAILGAPLEVHQHPDGRLLVYLRRARNTFRFTINPSQALRFVDLSQTTAEAVKNAKFTWERIHAGEDRLVLLIDADGVLQALGHRSEVEDLPHF